MNNASIGNITTANLTDWDKVKSLTDEEIIHDIDSPRTSEADWAQAFVSHSGAELHTEIIKRKRSANKLPVKEQVAIRFDAEILAYFRSTGKGWQTRMNEVLKEWIREHMV
ncbi:MAG: BrnA antitoxin family protein [Methylovulum sp.]|uniref:BrnA antitoxin family protein n=1 Tax=Methylovulum sp. TaxID=1916980 RepID=UPI00262305BB|nr:BrnA antitoxin family protein [Methylovulum sp.]MDD2723387.1 BrnA antitoxin family protein [Methylovulum sp.]MDD5126395.1 BrnA antitoxin family protein [Methylovulum sp.]